ncbi:MAG: chemotaxis protein CheW [Magnetococcus sp. DMHC-8]
MHASDHNPEYLIVNLTGTLYGVAACLVREVVRLPEITPMEDAPVFIVGVINLRGRVVPVLDLNSRMGRSSPGCYALSDAVVVLEQPGTTQIPIPLLGLLVNEVREIVTLAETDWESAPRFEAQEEAAVMGEWPEGGGGRRYRMVQGVAKVGEELVMLLAMDHLLHVQPADWMVESGEEEGPAGTEPPTWRRRFHPTFDAAAQPVFRERARRLRQRPDQQETDALLSLAIIRLHGEMLGVELRGVTGFAKVNKVTPVPCCPPHIAGSMNLRGEVLTLVDLRQVLDVTDAGTDQTMEKAVVVSMGHHDVGILVHDVIDVIHIPATELAATPAAASRLRGEHLQGAVPYGKHMLGILNLQAILANAALLVNEEV